MQEKVINIVQETLRSGTFEGMNAILDDVDMTVVLAMLLRLFCFLRLLRFWKEKRLLLFFSNGVKIECKIKWLNFTAITICLEDPAGFDLKTSSQHLEKDTCHYQPHYQPRCLTGL